VSKPFSLCIALFLCAGLFFSGCGSQAEKQKPSFYPLTGMPFDAVVTDLNRDGKKDAAVIVKYSGLYIYENTGGTLSPSPVHLQFLPHGTAIDTGDFNGDSIPDLAYILENTVQILINDGTGRQFNADRYLDGPQFSFSLKTPDLNNDGISDIIAVGNLDSRIYLYLSTAPMMFDLMKLDIKNDLMYFDFSARTLTVADLNGDGFCDVLVPEFRNSALWLIQNREGKSFVPRLIAQREPLDLIQHAVFLKYDSVKDVAFLAFISGTDKPLLTIASFSEAEGLKTIETRPLADVLPVHIAVLPQKQGEIPLIITHSRGIDTLKGSLTKAVIHAENGHILSTATYEILPSSGIMSVYLPELKSLLAVCQEPDGVYITSIKE
jgi:hypothetical protein